MGKKHKRIPVWCAVLLVLAAVCIAAAVISQRGDPANQPGESQSTEAPQKTTEEPTGEPTEAVTHSTESTQPPYDGAFQTLENGDSFYTPDTSHAVMDGDRTVLYYNDLLLVFTDSDLPAEEMDALAQSVGGETMGTVSGGIHAFQIKVDDSTLAELEALAQSLMEQEQVLYACSEYPVQIMGTKEDNNPWDLDGPEADRGNEAAPGGLDWWAEAIGAYTAWEYADQCQEVRVGIADNGFYANHEELQGRIVFVTNDENNTMAEHGTMVAGIIGAANNTVGIRGIADTATLYCADLWPLDSPDSYHTMGEYLAVINYMAQSGVRVVNNSWGCLVPSEETWLGTYGGSGGYQQWLDKRMNQDLIPTAEYCIVMISQLISSGYGDMIHVQAAGNGLDNGRSGVDARYNGFFSSVTAEVYNGMDASVLDKLTTAGITYEAIDARILVVGAVENRRDAGGNYYMASFSNFGETVDISAPGIPVYTTIPTVYDISYGAAGGTSLATPMVTGSVALLWSLDPELTVTELRQILLDSAGVRAVGSGSSEGWSCPMLNIGAAAQAVAKGMEPG